MRNNKNKVKSFILTGLFSFLFSFSMNYGMWRVPTPQDCKVEKTSSNTKEFAGKIFSSFFSRLEVMRSSCQQKLQRGSKGIDDLLQNRVDAIQNRGFKKISQNLLGCVKFTAQSGLAFLSSLVYCNAWCGEFLKKENREFVDWQRSEKLADRQGEQKWSNKVMRIFERLLHLLKMNSFSFISLPLHIKILQGFLIYAGKKALKKKSYKSAISFFVTLYLLSYYSGQSHERSGRQNEPTVQHDDEDYNLLQETYNDLEERCEEQELALEQKCNLMEEYDALLRPQDGGVLLFEEANIDGRVIGFEEMYYFGKQLSDDAPEFSRVSENFSQTWDNKQKNMNSRAYDEGFKMGRKKGNEDALYQKKAYSQGVDLGQKVRLKYPDLQKKINKKRNEKGFESFLRRKLADIFPEYPNLRNELINSEYFYQGFRAGVLPEGLREADLKEEAERNQSDSSLNISRQQEPRGFVEDYANNEEFQRGDFPQQQRRDFNEEVIRESLQKTGLIKNYASGLNITQIVTGPTFD